MALLNMFVVSGLLIFKKLLEKILFLLVNCCISGVLCLCAPAGVLPHLCMSATMLTVRFSFTDALVRGSIAGFSVSPDCSNIADQLHHMGFLVLCVCY